MDINEKPGRKRPNADYELSNKKNDDEKLVFYYSREKRLAKAPPSVQALYEEVPKKKRFGFFRSLTATRPMALLFASILILCAAILILSVFGGGGDAHMLGGNSITLAAMKFQGETLVVMNKSCKNDRDAYTGLVDVAVSPVVPEAPETENYTIFTHRIFFSLSSEEEYRFSLPFEADELIVVLQGEKDSVQFKINPK
jgi:hypothetical protein